MKTEKNGNWRVVVICILVMAVLALVGAYCLIMQAGQLPGTGN